MLFYSEESQRHAGVAAWVRRGLELGSKILYTQPEGDPPDRSLPGLLQDEPDALEAMERGQIQVVPADPSTYDPVFIEAVVDGALSDGYPSVRWSGDASTAWGVIPRSRHELVEQATDELCTSRPLSVLCQYSALECSDAIGPLSQSHGGGLREQRFQAAPVEGGLAVAGELDATNQRTLSSLLTTATAAAERDPFVVDLSWVDFLDLPGARAVLLGTLDHRSSGGRVRLQAPQPHVAQLLRLLGIDRAEGIQWGETR
ncbi:MEDS domain-containing protein [Nocardioides koreensis]|uniref:MEDS domain-containing protein n=1 Tax=Nocardioides koreensis TaxID=433651 RepID=UPI0031D4CF0D